jgi:hypothetical protein
VSRMEHIDIRAPGPSLRVWRRRAKASGMTLSAWIRKSLDEAPTFAPPADVAMHVLKASAHDGQVVEVATSGGGNPDKPVTVCSCGHVMRKGEVILGCPPTNQPRFIIGYEVR